MQECVVCLRTIRGRQDNWVVLPCDHGMCTACFTKLVTTQAPPPPSPSLSSAYDHPSQIRSHVPFPSLR